jgi:hypothetical protein
MACAPRFPKSREHRHVDGNEELEGSRLMRLARWTMALAAAAGLAGLAAGPAAAGTVAISGTRTNITPGGAPGGRCAPALTVSFGPAAFAASGTSTLGDFSYVASHCIAAPPPGDYFNGVFEWTLPTGTLFGTHTGSLTAGGAAGVFNVVENLIFTGGTGLFEAASGFAVATGAVRFGQFNGVGASFGDARFVGQVTAPRVPEPATWALLLAGFGVLGAVRRTRSAAA